MLYYGELETLLEFIHFKNNNIYSRIDVNIENILNKSSINRLIII